MFESFFRALPRGQRALLTAHDDNTALGAVLFNTVAHVHPFRWRYDLVGWAHRNRWRRYDFDQPEPSAVRRPRSGGDRTAILDYSQDTLSPHR